MNEISADQPLCAQPADEAARSHADFVRRSCARSVADLLIPQTEMYITEGWERLGSCSRCRALGVGDFGARVRRGSRPIDYADRLIASAMA